MLKDYYLLTKPGIIRGNIVTATAGFLLASKGDVHYWTLLYLLIGLSLVIACGCVFNNYIDRDIDRKMARTKKRALVEGRIDARLALMYGALLGIIGLYVLVKDVNAKTALIGVVGLFFYVVVYGYVKRRSYYGTIVGSISGATPPLAGYVAVTNHFDPAAWLLFLILVFWQMPHFYAIAIYRLKDYKAAGIPVLPLEKGISTTKVHIMVYIVAFTIAMLALSALSYTGSVYAIVAGLIGLGWFSFGLRGFRSPDSQHWARSMFFVSLLALTLWCVAVGLSGLTKHYVEYRLY